jgi:hypothetical protein
VHSAVYRESPRTLNELKTEITAYIRNISQADLQKVFANKIKRVQAYRRSWTSLPTPFISAQRLSERTVSAACLSTNIRFIVTNARADLPFGAIVYIYI